MCAPKTAKSMFPFVNFHFFPPLNPGLKRGGGVSPPPSPPPPGDAELLQPSAHTPIGPQSNARARVRYGTQGHWWGFERSCRPTSVRPPAPARAMPPPPLTSGPDPVPSGARLSLWWAAFCSFLLPPPPRVMSGAMDAMWNAGACRPCSTLQRGGGGGDLRAPVVGGGGGSEPGAKNSS